MSHPATTKRFRVALSFPGEHRARVERIAEALAAKLGREKVLYDKWYAAELNRPGLGIYLPDLYRHESDLIAIFLCKEYEKEWCGLEWRACLDLIKRREYGRLSQAPDSAASETAPLRSRLGSGVRSRDRQGADR
jgi:hypothetical protein